MAGSFFALFDDLSTLLDDVVTMTKLAAKKTSGVLGDDLALNAEQLRGMEASRELPVVLAVAKGSLKNKCILVPAALVVSELAAWAIKPALVLGGLFLCYEGVEKLAHKALTSKEQKAAHEEALRAALSEPAQDLLAFEADKIQSAIRTDFVLSAEIIVIALGTLASQPFTTRVAVLSTVALLMTVGVYGVVLSILKLDDAGLYLLTRPQAWLRSIGNVLVAAAPSLMRLLSVVGTAAVFLVGGGILVHSIAPLHHAVVGLAEKLPLGSVATHLLEALTGFVSGAVLVTTVMLFSQVRRALARSRAPS